MTGFKDIELWLPRVWWLIFPCFAALTARLAVERMCGNPYQLLPQATSDPSLAWLLAVVYVSAHWWFLAAYVVTVRRTQMLLPTFQAARSVWGNQSAKILLLLAAFIIEYAPLSVWQAIGVRVSSS